MSVGTSIERTLRPLERGHRLASLARFWLATAILAFVAAWIAELVLPRVAPSPIRLIALLVWSTGAVCSYRRVQVPIAELDRRLGLGDRLQTWFASGRETQSPAMRAWLGRELEARLDAVPALLSQRAVRRSLRPLRILVPILIALLLLRWFEPDRAQDRDTPVARAGSGEGRGGGGRDEPSPERGTTPTPTDEPTPTPDPEPESQPEATPDLEDDLPPPPAGPVEPTPLIEPDKWQDDFVVPQFVGDGPSETREAHVADIDERSPPDRPAARPPAVGSQPGEAPDPDPTRAFERAEERALRSRHVAERERPWVRRYFELLMERRR